MILHSKVDQATEETWPGCGGCKHYQGKGICAAFPEGIPFPIASGDLPHLEPFPSLQSNKIVFEPIGELPENAN